MDRATLKSQLLPIVIDETLTKPERSEKFKTIALELAKVLTFTDASEMWNNVMAEIVTEKNLRRH